MHWRKCGRQQAESRFAFSAAAALNLSIVHNESEAYLALLVPSSLTLSLSLFFCSRLLNHLQVGSTSRAAISTMSQPLDLFKELAKFPAYTSAQFQSKNGEISSLIAHTMVDWLTIDHL